MGRYRPVFRGKWGISGPQATPAHPFAASNARPNARKIKKGGRVSFDGAFPDAGGRKWTGNQQDIGQGDDVPYQDPKQSSSSTYRKRTTSKEAREQRATLAKRRVQKERTRPLQLHDTVRDQHDTAGDDRSNSSSREEEMDSDDLDGEPTTALRSQPRKAPETPETPEEKRRRILAEAVARRLTKKGPPSPPTELRTSPTQSPNKSEGDSSPARTSTVKAQKQAAASRGKSTLSSGKVQIKTASSAKTRKKNVTTLFIESESEWDSESESDLGEEVESESEQKGSEENLPSSSRQPIAPASSGPGHRVTHSTVKENEGFLNEPDGDGWVQLEDVKEEDPKNKAIFDAVFRKVPVIDPLKEFERKKRRSRQASESPHTSDFSSDVDDIDDDLDSDEREEIEKRRKEELVAFNQIIKSKKAKKRKAIQDRVPGYSNPRKW